MSRICTVYVLLAPALAAALCGCSSPEEPSPGQTWRAASVADAAGEGATADSVAHEATLPDAPGSSRETPPRWRGPLRSWSEYACKTIGATGCCKGEVLWWCGAEGKLRQRDCSGAGLPRCGWNSASKKYGCATAGASDPSGAVKHCMLAAENAWLPDSGRPTNSCQGISDEGCCAGNVLKFCAGGALQFMDCGLNPTCGWLPNAQQYDCGTAGLGDPAGGHPRTCPGSTPTDGVPDRGVDVTTDRGGDAGGDYGSGGCSCRLSSAPASPWLLLLAGLLLVARRPQRIRR